MAELTYGIANALASRLSSLTLDATRLSTGATLPPALIHDNQNKPPQSSTDVSAIHSRKFWLERDTTGPPEELGAFNWTNDTIRKSWALTVAYYASNSNRLQTESLASDDLDVMVRGLKRNLAGYSPAGVTLIQVDVEPGDFDYDEDNGGAIQDAILAVTYKRTY
jgi:hypothetical protein